LPGGAAATPGKIEPETARIRVEVFSDPFSEKTTVHGLVTILPSPYYEQVESLWKELETKHSLKGIRATPYPHFSWQIADNYDFPRLEQVMREVASQARSFEVQTTGLGVFTGPRPVIFIPLVKTIPLMELHALLWERTQSISQGLSPYYDPQTWTPHISLAYEDVDIENIANVMSELAFQSFAGQLPVHNLALIYEPAGTTGILRSRFEFSKPMDGELA
jgi:2'-5' RNA ligase